MNLEQIPVLNSTYCRLTGYPQPLNWHAEGVWQQWLNFCEPAWTVADLELVIRYIQKRMRKHYDAVGYTPNSLRFDRLIQDAEKFCLILGPARAEARKPVYTPRDRVLEQSGRPAKERSKERSAAAILAGQEAFKKFLDLRDEL